MQIIPCTPVRFGPAYYTMTQRYLAQTCYEQGNWSYAIEFCSAVIAAEPLSPLNDQFYYYRAMSYFNLSNLEFALADFNRLIDKGVLLPESYLGRSQCRICRMDVDGSLADCNEAIRLAPSSLPAYRHRCSLYIFMKRWARAIEDLTVMIALHPADAAAYLARAVCHRQLKQYQAAILDLNVAIELNPCIAEYYAVRSYCHRQRGARKQAVDDACHALTLDPRIVLPREIQALLRPPLRSSSHSPSPSRGRRSATRRKRGRR